MEVTIIKGHLILEMPGSRVHIDLDQLENEAIVTTIQVNDNIRVIFLSFFLSTTPFAILVKLIKP